MRCWSPTTAPTGAAPTARVEIDRGSGHVTVWAAETGEDGAVLREYDDTPDGFGRIAATTARQVILQRLRDAEDELTFGEYAGREGDIVAGVIQQGKDPRAVLVDLGKIEAILPPDRAGAGRAVRARRAAAVLRAARAQGLPGAVGHAVPHPSEPGEEAVRAGGAGDRLRRGGDRRHRPRGRPPHQDRGDARASPGSTPRAPASGRWAAGSAT